MFVFEFPDSRFKNIFSKVIHAWLVCPLLKQTHRCAREPLSRALSTIWTLKV